MSFHVMGIFDTLTRLTTDAERVIAVVIGLVAFVSFLVGIARGGGFTIGKTIGAGVGAGLIMWLGYSGLEWAGNQFGEEIEAAAPIQTGERLYLEG